MDQVNFFKCLSDETRLNIVTLIVENKELCVCDLTEKLQLSQPKISRHLALLRASGLLQDRRQGPLYCKQDIFIFYIQWLIFLLIGNTMKNTMLRKGLTIF
ncbi:hypothetical protein F938_00240 [Acinetobacter bereziniae LMG 1003 = CIP 70.12]|uniref:HTH arsR-type domain-containing protein n=1 Tax=Acinetobacter bereziniae LMG 1003 = CIP 70.12 TaxID=981324 RepID=N9FBA2_ACIBZ|nr:metalloregulator ArsR/SmtB family transcription factor [Acinetobacter bereziniae]ENW02129.1 hypothetical protein F938_00240 [Acinetobacter bereziniae LMG 1003 = CIP 70.12]